MLRPAMNTPEGVREQVEGVILGPTMVQLAYDRHIDQDPEAKALIDKKHEELLVGHMYEDSIQSRIKVTSDMRHKFYANNKKGYFTYPRVRYAAISTHSRASADSLKARLVHGEKADAILFADSLAGLRRGSIQERSQNEHGPYQKVLFEELRPGQVSVDGPDRNGDYIVLQSIAYDPGHQLQYAEVEKLVDESVQSIASEELLNKFIARHRKEYGVEVHPEQVMRFQVANPS